MNFERLRFVAERAELGEQREAMLAVEIPEQPGSLRQFCRLLGSHSLTEFSYRQARGHRAQIFVGVETSNRQDAMALMALLEEGGFSCVDLSSNELAKLHLRHMVGGRPKSAFFGNSRFTKSRSYRTQSGRLQLVQRPCTSPTG